MEKQVCKQCKHFRQHYSMDEQRVFRVHCGHCTLNVKRRRPEQTACESFQKGKSQEKAFPDKAYLSKFLLRYMEKLEILPKIYPDNTKLK